MATSPLLERKLPPFEDDGPLASRLRGPARAGLIPLLALLFAIGLALFVAVNPPRPWVLLTLTALVGLGADGVIRGHPRGHFASIADTAPHLFVPVLFSLSAGLFLEDVVLGYWAVPAVMGAGVLMACALYAEHISVDVEDPSFPAARFVLNLVTYLAAFGFYSVVYGFDVSLMPAALSLGIFAWLLTLHPSAAGRTYAAYGGMYIAVALIWLWQVDGVAPTRWDWVGAGVALAGMAIIALQPPTPR